MLGTVSVKYFGYFSLGPEGADISGNDSRLFLFRFAVSILLTGVREDEDAEELSLISMAMLDKETHHS